MIKEIRDFVASWPGFAGIPFPVDVLGPMPGCGAVMPRGEEILQTLEDIRGGVAFRKRLTADVLLAQGLDPMADGWEPHERLLEFARWCQQQDKRITAKGPFLQSRGDDGVARYRLELRFEFTENLEKEHDHV